MAAKIRYLAPGIHRHDAGRHRQLLDRGDAHRDTLETVAEPRPPRNGIDRRRAGEISRLRRARPRRAHPQAFPRLILRRPASAAPATGIAVSACNRPARTGPPWL